MTFESALKTLKTKFKNVDATKLADMAVQVTLTDEDCGGTLYFKAVGGSLEVAGYDYRDNDAIIDIERKALMDILSGKLTLDMAIEKGQATAKGNFEKLETLKAAIPAYVAPKKKAPAKKAPAKKAEPVKAEAPKATVAKKAEPVKAEAPKATAAKKAEPVKVEAPKATAAKKAEPVKVETAKKAEPVKKAPAKKTTKKA